MASLLITRLAGATAIVLTLAGAVQAQSVSSGEVFQVEADGTMIHIDTCITDPYPKCTFRYQRPDGSFGPVLDDWNESLAELRDYYAQSVGAFVQQPGEKARTCEPTVNTGFIDGTVPFSPGLAQEVIRNFFTSTATPNNNISVSFQSLRQGNPILNERGYDAATGANLVTFGAPENSILYPVSMQFTVCTETSTYTAEEIAYDWNLYCFVDDYNEWTCGTY